MRVLVTGATGFVGKCLVSELKTKKIPLSAVGLSPSCYQASSSFLVSSFARHEGFKNILPGTDCVIHLAARVHVMQEVNNAIDPLHAFLETNLHGTINIAMASAKAGVKRFIYISSIKVNGEHTDTSPFCENDIVSPIDSYAISKREAELALRTIELETGMEVVIIRSPLVYGPGVKANFLNLLKLVNTGIPLPLAAVNNKRSLIYLGNLVDALIQCAVHPAAAGNTYLVSDGQDVSTPELIRYIADSLKTPARLLKVPLPLLSFIAKLLGKSGSVERLTQSLVIDSSKIRNELGWLPPYTLEQGLAATAAWFKENH